MTSHLKSLALEYFHWKGQPFLEWNLWMQIAYIKIYREAPSTPRVGIIRIDTGGGAADLLADHYAVLTLADGKICTLSPADFALLVDAGEPVPAPAPDPAPPPPPPPPPDPGPAPDPAPPVPDDPPPPPPPAAWVIPPRPWQQVGHTVEWNTGHALTLFRSGTLNSATYAIPTDLFATESAKP